MSVVEKAIAKLRTPGSSDLGRPKDEPGSTEIATRMPEPDVALAPATSEDKHPPILVDRIALRAKGFVPDSDQERRLADQYRQVKRTILTRLQELDPLSSASSRWFMFSSALPGDGKSFTSINLAFSLAREPGASVVLVDGDLPKRHVSNVFGIDHAAGLSDALSNPKLAPESLVLSTNVQGLSILSAGTKNESATDQLNDESIIRILTKIVAQDPRRIVVLDSPPLLLSVEARALAQAVGNVVLVVRAGGTPQRAVQDALAQIGPNKLIGVVLNQSPMAHTEGYYGYGTYGADGTTGQKN